MTRSEEVLNSSGGGGLFPRLQARYGLRSDPSTMEAPFFPDAQRQHALETLRHLCGFGDLALILTGARGAGKSRVLAELVRSESSRLGFHSLPLASLTSVSALAKSLLTIAQISPSHHESPRDAIHGFFRWSETATRRGQRLVLLIDDADQAPRDVLKFLLSAFRKADASHAAVPVLTGEDPLMTELRQSSAEEAGHSIHLRPLTLIEVRDYLEPRIQAAGGNIKELLSTRNLARLHELSQGNFGRLKRLAPAVWLDLATPAAASDVWRRQLPGLRWSALALILLGVSWWVVSKQYETVSEPSQFEQAQVRERKTISLGPESPDAPRVSVSAAEGEPLVGPASSLVPAPVSAAGPETPDDSQPGALSAINTDSAPAAIPESRDSRSPATRPDDERVLDKDAEEKAADGKSVAESEQEPSEQEPKEEVEQPSGFSPASPGRFVTAAEAKAAGGYTAQYIAGFAEETALEFLDRHSGVDQLRYTLSERQGRPWFVVFYGRYESLERAREGQQSVPLSLKGQEPWLRPLATF